MEPPVRIGEILQLEMAAQTPRGEGIARKDDFVVFVKGAKTGDRCRVRITDVKRTYAIGERV